MVVKANNELRSLRAREKTENDAHPDGASADCAADTGRTSRWDFTMLVELDAIFARAKLSFKLNCGRLTHWKFPASP